MSVSHGIRISRVRCCRRIRALAGGSSIKGLFDAVCIVRSEGLPGCMKGVAKVRLLRKGDLKQPQKLQHRGFPALISPFPTLQVHGYYPSAATPALSHRHQGGHRHHLAPGFPAGFPPGLLLSDGGAAGPAGVSGGVAGAQHQRVRKNVS